GDERALPHVHLARRVPADPAGRQCRSTADPDRAGLWGDRRRSRPGLCREDGGAGRGAAAGRRVAAEPDRVAAARSHGQCRRDRRVVGGNPGQARRRPAGDLGRRRADLRRHAGGPRGAAAIRQAPAGAARRVTPLGPEGFAALTGVSRETVARLEGYAELLKRWSGRINLVSRNTLGDLWRRHFLDSAQLLPLIPQKARSLV